MTVASSNFPSIRPLPFYIQGPFFPQKWICCYSRLYLLVLVQIRSHIVSQTTSSATRRCAWSRWHSLHFRQPSGESGIDDACMSFLLRIIHRMRPHGYVDPHIRSSKLHSLGQLVVRSSRGHINRQVSYYPWLPITNTCIDGFSTLRASHWNRQLQIWADLEPRGLCRRRTPYEAVAGA